MVMHQADGDRARTDGRGDAFDRPVPDVADREDPGQAGFQEHRQAPQRPLLIGPPALEKVGAGNDKPRLIAPDGVW
jgi:hypothetical protein